MMQSLAVFLGVVGALLVLFFWVVLPEIRYRSLAKRAAGVLQSIEWDFECPSPAHPPGRDPETVSAAQRWASRHGYRGPVNGEANEDLRVALQVVDDRDILPSQFEKLLQSYGSPR